MPPVRFGIFELDEESGELSRQGRKVHLAAQPFKVLCLLIQNAGVVVVRDDLRRHIWGDDTFVEFDRSLNFCIASVRAALNDDARSPRFIETVPRRGYRFIADVRRDAASFAAAARPTPTAEPMPTSRLRRWAWAAALPLLLAQYPAGARAHSRTTALPEARAAFERGLAATSQGVAGARRGIYAFRQATRLDPRFAEAHYALADTYLDLAGKRALPPAAALAEARASALLAVSLEDAAESRTVLGTTRLLNDWDWDGARRDLQRAVALAPRWDGGLVSLARMLSAEGDDRSALETIDRAETISPSCDLILMDAGRIYARAGRFAEAARKFEDAIVFGPPHAIAAGDWEREVRLRLLLMHASQRDWAASHRQALAILSANGAAETQRQRFAAADPHAAVLSFLRRSVEMMNEAGAPPTRIAALHAAMGNSEAAIESLKRAFTERDLELVYALRDPEFAAVRDDARIRAIARQGGSTR